MPFRTVLFVLICLLSSFARGTSSASRSDDSEQVEYVAAVLEHHAHQALPFQVNSTTQEAIKFMMENLDEYEQAAAEASEKGAQIIVFPEDAIYGVGLASIQPYAEIIPEKRAMSSEKIVPCEDESFEDRVVLQRLSCIARKFHIALVANMADSQPPHFYNTDVVFDTDGRLLTKYHKVHLFFEDNFTPNTDPDPDSVFTTSFGVRFGLCTCYDILFTRPCFDYATKLGITDLVFPTAWINAFPLLYSTTVQQAFSKMTNSNVLAANLHYPEYRFTGSGIFSGGSPKALFMSNEDSGSKGRLLLAKLRTKHASTLPSLDTGSVAKSELIHLAKSTAETGEFGKVDMERIAKEEASYTYKPLPPSSKSFELCSQGFCCHAEYDIDLADGELFSLGVFHGLKPHQPETFYYETCAVVKCSSASPSSCGQVPSDSTVESLFRFLHVHARFDPSVDSIRLYPVVFTSGFKLLDMTTDIALGHRSDNTWEMNVTTPFRLLSAGIFGRPVSLSMAQTGQPLDLA